VSWADDGSIVGVGDMYAQTKQTFRNIEKALVQAGATFANVVRTRMFMTDVSRWDEVAKAHGEIFGDIRPAATGIGIAALVQPEFLIEIEVDAIL
jgi:enamine deaminase RidA (YjgF/YER057c/UK114 family)